MITKRYGSSIVFFIIVVFFYACKTNKAVFFSYNIQRFTCNLASDKVDTIKRPFNFSSVLSYGDYLFEYKIATHFNTEIHGDKPPIRTVKYDTTGVYLLSAKTKQYYEFDTFALETKLIEKGSLSAKPLGIKSSSVAIKDSADTNYYYEPAKEVLINNIQCYYSNVVFKNTTFNDTI